MNIHELTCTDCEKQAKMSVYELIGAGWQVVGTKAYCPEHQKERK